MGYKTWFLALQKFILDKVKSIARISIYGKMCNAFFNKILKTFDKPCGIGLLIHGRDFQLQ